MKTITHTAILAFSAEQIYNLVNDIESYPAFLTWCKKAVVTERSENELQASLTVAKGLFEKTFTTRNYLVANESVKLTLVNGPFKHFEGLWQFETLDAHRCKVSYTMEFEFSNMLVGKIAEPIFSAIANTIINAFKTRAEKIYQ